MKFRIVAAFCLVAVPFGCAGRPSLLPNSDPELRQTMAELAADGAKRHPYKSEVPRGGDALARASVDYTFKTIQVLNYSDIDWYDVELWVNQNYVVHVPKIPHGKDGAKTLDFTMFFDDKGEYFWTDHGKAHVDQLEVLREGKIYNIKTAPAD
jgi:hypothetical protein